MCDQRPNAAERTFFHYPLIIVFELKRNLKPSETELAIIVTKFFIECWSMFGTLLQANSSSRHSFLLAMAWMSFSKKFRSGIDTCRACSWGWPCRASCSPCKLTTGHPHNMYASWGSSRHTFAGRTWCAKASFCSRPWNQTSLNLAFNAAFCLCKLLMAKMHMTIPLHLHKGQSKSATLQVLNKGCDKAAWG